MVRGTRRSRSSLVPHGMTEVEKEETTDILMETTGLRRGLNSLLDEEFELFQMLLSGTPLPPVPRIHYKELRHATREETGDILERVYGPDTALDITNRLLNRLQSPGPGMVRGTQRSSRVPHGMTEVEEEETTDILMTEILPEAELHGLYSLTCPVPGWFRCQRTGLVLRGCGKLVYRVVSLDRDFLCSRGLEPAGPLFHFNLLQGSFSELQLPHCETSSGRAALMVVHVTGSGVEFLTPRGVSEVTASVAITGFCGYALVRPISQSPVPIRGLVLLFHQTDSEPELCSSLFLLLLPRNVVIAEVIKMWKMRSMAQYIETLHDCVLVPNQTYLLSGKPVQLVQPQNAEFLNFEDYDNYCASFEAHLARGTRHVELCLETPVWGAGRLLQWLLPIKSSVVWRGIVQIQGAVTLDTTTGEPANTPFPHAAEDLKVKEALLDVLKQLSPPHFETFQARLSWHPHSIPCSSLKGADRITTVDIMIEKYLPSRAKKTTIDILKLMSFNNLVVGLESAE